MPRVGFARLVRVFTVAGVGILVALVVVFGPGEIRERAETMRTSPEFDPPVWAGQLVPAPCATGGFYAREDQTLVLTISAHCGGASPGVVFRDSDGRVVGTFGPAAELADCPADRFCAPSDFLTLALAPDRIPWGHLNLVDMGAGGYRTIDRDTRPLTCGDVHVGDRVEVNGREHFRSGTVLQVGPYEHATDTIFPCMAVSDIGVFVGDSGGAVLVNGLPAGITSRNVAGYLAFTPLAEGLANLGLALCTTPDCDLSPPAPG
jgi:hypothetical protein